MRVLVATHNYPRFAGDPAGAFVHRIAAGCVARGDEVVAVAPHAAGLAREGSVDGVTLRRFRYAPDAWERVAYGGDLHRRPVRRAADLLALPSFLAAFALALRRAVGAFRPDVIHAHWWVPGGAAATAGVPRLPLVITCHGSDVRLLASGGARALGRAVLGRADVITTVSRFLAQDIAGRLPELRERLEVAPMPIDVARFEAARGIPRAEPARLLYAGNLVPSKGLDVLLRAFAMLRTNGVDCRLRVLGEGPLRAELEALAGSLGVARDVDWSDFVGQDRMPQEYAEATVTVLPSRGHAEGLGLTLVEALLAGCSVVGTPAGGIPEVVEDGVTGLMAPDGDAAALAGRLRRLLTDPELRRRLSAAGAARMREVYAPEPAIARFSDLYHAAVRRARRS